MTYRTLTNERRSRPWRLRWLLAALVVAACSGSLPTAQPEVEPSPAPTSTAAPTTEPVPDPTPPGRGPVPTEIGADGFDDHTVGSIDTVDDFFALARTDATGQSVVKFTIPDLAADAVRWFDSSFYELHDEWYWFRLLNGYSVPGFDTAPAPGLEFRSIDQIYAWASANPDLPLDLAFTASDRLYSPRYYDEALFADGKSYGLGSVIHFPPNAVSDRDRWVIQLEYSEATTPETIGQFFERLQRTLPTAIADDLEWVVRSPQQAETAIAMQTDGLPYSEQIVYFADLVPAGEVAVYNEGIAAGRLRLIGDGDYQLTDAVDTDILILDSVPDWLSPASAVLSSAPQTPLAHVNLLARNRGIPNVSIAGLLNDPAVASAARVRAYAIVRASGVDQVDVTLITKEQFEAWQDLQSADRIAVPPVNTSSMPTIVELTSLAATIENEDDVESWRPIIGGKSAGFLALLSAGEVTTPEEPLAITVAPYLEHLGRVNRELEAMLGNDDFRRHARTRFLLLEGSEDYAGQYTSEPDAAYADQFVANLGADDPLRRIVEADGFKGWFRDMPMNAETLTEIIEALETTYGDYADTQGLRFRSSSSVEDIEGFSGAGLYDSNTGFLKPELQPDEKDQKKSVERTLKKTWASYWGFEAYEERRRENVDHRSGAMAVLVHARFDDPLEQNNGVATFTLLPAGADNESRAVVNVQVGDVSVTNPDPSTAELPEHIEVTADADGEISIDRIAESTLATGQPVLTDAAVEALFEQLESVARLWRDRVNASLPADQRIETLTLDYEFKTMAPGWPALDDGSEPRPGRLVIKQARSLDPGLRGLPAAIVALPVPRDVLARAQLIEQVQCPGGTRVEILTDPLLPPDIGYSQSPFVTGEITGDADTTGCERTILHSTPDRFLHELLEAGEGLAIS